MRPARLGDGKWHWGLAASRLSMEARKAIAAPVKHLEFGKPFSGSKVQPALAKVEAGESPASRAIVVEYRLGDPAGAIV